jgi:hypothetical protein
VEKVETKGSESPGSELQHESDSLLSILLQHPETALSALIAVIFGAAQHELDGLCLCSCLLVVL